MKNFLLLRDTLMQDPLYIKLMEYAMRALARRAHTAHELQVKLRKRQHHSPENEARIIARLKELNLLNDEDYVRRSIEQASQYSHQGRFKIAQKLKHKGIPYKTTDLIWNDMNIDEKAVAKNALKKIQKRIKDLPAQKRRSKRAQFLAGRGFPPSIVFELAKVDEMG